MASLRRTYDDMMLHAGDTLTIVTLELVHREGRDDPSMSQANIIQEKEQDNAKKLQHQWMTLFIRCWQCKRLLNNRSQREMTPQKVVPPRVARAGVETSPGQSRVAERGGITPACSAGTARRLDTIVHSVFSPTKKTKTSG